MILEALRLVLALAFLVILPGWLLLRALWPAPRTPGPAERAYLIPASGVLLLMLIGIVLGFLPHAGSRGHLQSLALGGMPNVELSMLGTCLLLTWIGLQRGAHPWLAARLPTSWRARASAPPQDQAP